MAQPAELSALCLGAGPSGPGVTERAARQILSLPMYPQLSEEMIECIITQIQNFFSRLS
jgi:dTDP-4-amino-4,6-dideoxygalactose transaminase